MITINNSIFDAQGTSVKDKVYGITLNGNEDITINGCTFKNQGYASILNHCAGDVIIEDCKFETSKVYNPIEGSQSVANGNVTVKGCEFTGTPGNNYINFYNVANNTEHEITGCTFAPSVDNNSIRLSNKNNSTAKFIVRDCEYTFAEGEPTEYTGFILCQDYTSKSGVKQDFSKYTIELSDVVCNGEKLTSVESAPEGCVYYVYQDGAGVITGENDPVISVK